METTRSAKTYLSILGLFELNLLEGQGSALRLENCSFVFLGKFRHSEGYRDRLGSSAGRLRKLVQQGDIPHSWSRFGALKI
jgi:hypothetical protein